jgi:FMN phosphatase YigB (HAD superfamily)
MTNAPAVAGAVDAVTFDFWDTLLASRRGDVRALRHARWRELTDRPDAELTEALDRYEAALRVARARTPAGPTLPLATRALEELPDLLAEVSRAVLAEAFCLASSALPIVPAPALGATLRALAAAGVRVGIVSNVATTISELMRGYLADAGLLDLFSGYAFSDESEVAKPDPAIFRRVLTALGVSDPARAVHVGDSHAFDVAGATAAGMRAIRFAGFRDEPGADGDAVPVIRRLSSLLPLLRAAPPHAARA